MSVKKSFFDKKIFETKIQTPAVKLWPEGIVGYFVGPTLALLSNSVLAGYFTKYLSDVLNMNVWAADFLTLLPIVSVIFVVLGNILVGRLMDKKTTLAGKARPLLLLSIPLSILALMILFVVAPFSTDVINPQSHTLALICIALGYNLWFAFAYPMYYTSHAALVSLSTRNSGDRSLLGTISNATALAAMGLCSMVLPFFLKLFLFVENEDGTINQLASFKGWKIFVLILLVINIIGVIIEFYFTKERVTEESFVSEDVNNKKEISIKAQWQDCKHDCYWWIIIIFFFLYQFGGMIKNVSQIYFCQAMWGEDYNSMHGTLSIIGAIPTAIGMVVAPVLAAKLGKAKSILAGAIIAVIGGAIGFIDPTNFLLVVVSFCIKALGSTPAMYLSIALLADVLDHQEALNTRRTDGLSMTIYGAIMAGMTGVVTGIIFGVQSSLGYDASNLLTITASGMQQGMTWLFIGAETICYLLIVLIFIFMDVEKYNEEDLKIIKKRQQEYTTNNETLIQTEMKGK